MARIRIEDLPVAEDLAPEELELLLGAGRPPFGTTPPPFPSTPVRPGHPGKPPASAPPDPTLLVKVPYKTAAEVCQVVDLSKPSLELLRPGQTPRQLLDSLLAREEFPDAIRFLTGA